MFNLNTGYFLRWGKTFDDDPEYCPFGDEILDIEVSTICHNNCPFCYKTNTSEGENMSFENFKIIVDKLPPVITQIAFGIGDINANPDLWKMMEYSRSKNIIPNITINGKFLTDNILLNLKKYCGAVAVSLYDKETCFNVIKKLTDLDMNQINIHCLLSEETYDKCMNILANKFNGEPRLKKLNAIVFLWLKPKGERNTFHQLKDKEKFKKLVNYALNNNISIRFDSCSSSNFLNVIKDTCSKEKYDKYYQMVEPCESTLFSYYINTKGIGYPCSFTEGIKDYKGIDVIKCKNFLKDVWYNQETIKFRNSVLKNKDSNNCRMCPLYNLNLKR